MWGVLFTTVGSAGTASFTTLGSNRLDYPIPSPEDRLKDHHRVLLMQLRHLERLRAWLPSGEMAPTGSVLSTVLVAVLEETTEIRRRISLLAEVASWGLLPDHAALLESMTEAEEWAIPSKEEIW